jgi:type VI protein secretion system component Hcp
MPGKSRKNRKDAKAPARKAAIEDLDAKTLNDREARDVKGGGASMSDISITKYVDKSTPKLF